MNTVRRIAKNTLVLLIAQIVSMGLGFFYIMYTARYLGAEGFGVLSFALAFTGMFGIFSDMGLSQLVVREVARDKTLAGKYVGNAIFIKIILSIFTLFFIFMAINILNYPQKTIVVVSLIAMSVILGAFTKIFYSIFQAYERMEFQSIGQIINSALLFSGAVIAIFYEYDIVAFAFLYLIVSIANLLYSLVVSIVKFTKPTIKYEYRFWKELFKEGLPFAITGISINIYLWIDTVMLSLLKGDEVVGVYNAAYKLVLVLLFIPIIFNNSIFPLMSQYFISSENALNISFQKLFKSMIFIGLPLGFGTMFLADKIVLLIYGSQFISSIIILQILIWSAVLIFARSPFERLLESINRQALVTKIFIIGAFFNVIVNLILIPRYSYIGAGIATVFTDLIVLIFLIIYTNNIGFVISKNELLDITKIIFACATMGIFLKYSLYLNLNLLIIIIFAAIIYGISSIMLKIFNKDDVALIKLIFNKEGI